jgi:hypothetical protein
MKKLLIGLLIGLGIAGSLTALAFSGIFVNGGGTGVGSVPLGSMLIGSSTNRSLTVIGTGTNASVLTMYNNLPAWRPAAGGGSATTTIQIGVAGTTINGPNFIISTSTTGTGTLKVTGSGSTINFALDTSGLQGTGAYLLTVATTSPIGGDGTTAHPLTFTNPGYLLTVATTSPISGAGTVGSPIACPACLVTGGTAGAVANSVTFNSSGGASANTAFNGSAGVTVDYHTVGAQIAGTYLTASSTIIAGGTATHSPSITFATSTDTNLLLSIVCATATCTFNPSWTGTLADARIASAATWSGKQNALSFPLAVNLGGTGSTSLNTTLVAQGTNLYFTNALAAGAISLTTTGTSGASTYNNSTGALNIPNYTSSGGGATTTIQAGAIINGPTFVFASGSPDTTWNIIGSGSTITFNHPNNLLTSFARSATKTVCASNALDTTNCDYKATATTSEVAIQAALTSLNGHGGTVALSDGTFGISTSTWITASGTTISGMGAGGTILKADSGLSVPIMQSALQLQNVTITGIKFAGALASTTSGTAIGFQGWDLRNSTITNNWFNGFPNEGIYLNGDANLGWYDMVQNNDIDSNGIGYHARYNEYSYIVGNSFSWNTTYSAESESDADWYQYNTFDATTGLAELYLPFGTGEYNVDHNSFTRFSQYGIVMRSINDSKFTNNIFDSVPASKAAIQNGQYGSEAGSRNVFANNNTTGSTNSGSVGIAEVSATDHNSYTGNVFQNVSAAYSLNGASTSYSVIDPTILTVKGITTLATTTVSNLLNGDVVYSNNGTLTTSNNIQTDGTRMFIANDIPITFGGGSGSDSSFKTGSDGTFLFDVGSNVSIKLKSGSSSTHMGYTDGSFNYVWNTDGSGNTNQNGSLTVQGTGSLATTTISQLTVSSLTSGNCVQASTAGLLTTTGSPCGSGGLASYNVTSANGLITVSTSTTLATLTASTSPTFTNLYLTNALPVTQGGTGLTSGYNNTNWDTAYTQTERWNGGSTDLVAATGRTSLGLGTMALLANTGSSTITTLGTIGTGTWQGTAIGDTYISSAATWNGKLSTVTADAPLGGSGTSGSHLTCTGCLTANQTITLTGAVSGSGTTAITTTYAGINPVATGGTGQSAIVAGQILFGGSAIVASSTNLTFTTGTNTLAVTGTSTVSNFFAVGTTTPLVARFTLQNAAGTTDIFRMASSTGATLDEFDFQGHLGIGTTTDTSNLSIQGTAGQSYNLFNISSSSGASLLTVASAADTSFSVMASSTAGTNDYYFKVNSKGVSASSTVPTVASCGTSPSVTGSNSAFTVTVGSVSATTCTVTFVPAYTNTPVCTVSSQTGTIAVGYTKTNTSIILTNAALTSDLVDVHCWGNDEP